MTHRLFLAFDLPEETKHTVGSFLSQSSLISLPVHWEKPEKLHLTLNFLGRMDDGSLALLQKRLQKVVPQLPSLKLRLMFLECLYKRHGDSLIYLAPTGDVDLLKSLRQSLSQMLETDLQIPQTERFLPHVLIGRPLKADPPTIKRLLDTIRDLEFEPTPFFELTSISLYESYLSKAGSFYQKIGQYALK